MSTTLKCFTFLCGLSCVLLLFSPSYDELTPMIIGHVPRKKLIVNTGFKDVHFGFERFSLEKLRDLL